MNSIKVGRSVIYQLLVSVGILLLLSIIKDIRISQICLFIVFCECFVISLNGRFFNLYQIFLLMMLFFGVSIPIFNLFGMYDYPSGYMFMYDAAVREPLTTEIMVETYKVYTVVLLGSSVGWLFVKSKIEDVYRNEKYLLNTKSRIYSLIKFAYCVLWPLEFIYQIVMLRASSVYGYVATIHLKSSLSSVASVLSLVDMLYPLFGFILLYYCDNEKSYFKSAVILAVPYMMQIFTGQRGLGLSMILTLIFVYATFFKKISFSKIAAVFIAFFILIITIGSYRFTRNLDSLSSSNLFYTITNEFAKNSESIIVTSYTIKFMDVFTNKVPFLFGYIFAIFSFSSNYTIEGILNKSYLAQHITYMINPNKLLGGSTIGTSIVAEFYEFTKGNYFFIFVLSVLLIVVAGYFIKKLYRNELYFYFGITYIQYLFLSPRGSVMKLFNKISVVYLILFIIILQINENKRIVQ